MFPVLNTVTLKEKTFFPETTTWTTTVFLTWHFVKTFFIDLF